MAERAPLDAQNPWPGLASFGEGDQAYFRGREREADELARLVRRERLTVLFGRSGLGKSSLLNAGLFPRLREELHLPVMLRIGYAAGIAPRQQVWDALAQACAAGKVQAPAPEPHETLWAYFHRAGAGFWNPRRRPLLPVLVFDQFEEVFTLGQADEATRAAAQAFLDELADLVEDRPSQALRLQLATDPARGEQIDFQRRSCKLLLSFREDFLAEVEGLRGRMPSLMRNRFRLLAMDGAQARAVIGSGGALVGGEEAERIIGLAWHNQAVAPTLAEADRIEVDPALLSVICRELNLRRLAAGSETIAAALLAGAEREILVDFYARAMQGLDPAVRRFVEDELITAGGFRDSFAYDDAMRRPGISATALDSLVAGRLLRLDERFGVRQLELTHDVLTRVVMDSRDQRREREAREQAEREREQAQQAAGQAERRLRRSRWLAGTMAAAALVASSLLGLVVDAYHWASKNQLPPNSMVTLQQFRLVAALQQFRLGSDLLPPLVAIPAGQFDMGEHDQAFIASWAEADKEKKGGEYGVKNKHVVMPLGYKLGQHEVTFDEYDYFVWRQNRDRPAGPAYPLTARGGRGSRAVVNVNGYEAAAYADWLGQQPGYQNCRLPTEAEWEYAARGGTQTSYWWGAEVGNNRANCKDCGGRWGSQSAPVEELEKNPFGLSGMGGNVIELTCSAWSPAFSGAEVQCATAAETGLRVLRDGSFVSDKDRVRASRRYNLAPTVRLDNVGFRIMCSPPLQLPLH